MNYDARWGYYAPSDRGGVNPTQQMAAIAANQASGWNKVSNDPRSFQSPVVRQQAQANAVAQAPSASAVEAWEIPELVNGSFASEEDYYAWTNALMGAQANPAALGAPRDPRQPLNMAAGIHQSRLNNSGAAFQFGVEQGWLEEDPDFGSWDHFTGSVLPYLAIAAPAILGIAGAGLASSATGPAAGAGAGAGTTFGGTAAATGAGAGAAGGAAAAGGTAATTGAGSAVADPVLASGSAPVSQPWQAPFYNPGAAAPTASNLSGIQALEATNSLAAGGAAVGGGFEGIDAGGVDYGGLNTEASGIPGPTRPDPMYSFGGESGLGLDAATAGLGFTASPAAFSSFGAGPAAASFSLPQVFSGLGASDWLSIAGGAYGIYSSEEQRKRAKEAAAMQDPFGPQRAQYAAQLAKLNANPSSVTSLPGYQFGMDQGNQALLRTMAATGYTGSGNEAIALQKFGQEYAGNYLAREQERLAQLAGANFAPSGGNTYLSGNNTADEILRMSLASIGYGLGGRGRSY